MGEMARLAQTLAPLMIAADLLVMRAERFEYWQDTPDTVYNRALREGKLHEQVARICPGDCSTRRGMIGKV